MSVSVGREDVKFSVLQIKAAADSRTWDSALCSVEVTLKRAP